MRKGPDGEGRKKASGKRIWDPSVLPWILVGFLASYLLFFLRPIFLNPHQVMLFPKYLPTAKAVGFDLSGTLSQSRTWLVAHRSPYMGVNPYPPLANVLFAPLLFLPFPSAYLIISLLTIACYGISTLWFARLASPTKSVTPTLLLLAVTGLLSYGFQWELERGQFNVIAMTLALAAVGLFYARPRFRWASYVLITLSIQLKVYPAILILALVEDWRNWKKELIRLLGILGVNFACLFALGPRVFQDFVEAIRRLSVGFDPFVGDHSAATFAFNLLPIHPRRLEMVILALFALFLLYAIWVSYRRKRPGLNPYLLLACCIGALIIPSTSNDYTLPLLVPVIAVFFQSLVLGGKGRIRTGLGIFLLVLMSLAYSAMLFSYTTRSSLPFLDGIIPPFLLENNLPALFVVLLAATGLVALGHVPSREAALSDAGNPSGSAG